MRRLLIIPVLVLVAAMNVAAKDWRGLLPMHSTREDVKNLLGPPSEDINSTESNRLLYLLEDANVEFFFINKGDLARGGCVASVPEGTIFSISVTPRIDMPFSSLNLDEKKLVKIDASEFEHPDQEGYKSAEEGIAVRVAKGNVEQVVYLPTAEDQSRCSTYYESIEQFVRTRKLMACGMAFDSYGDIRFSDEKARLDNFAIQLQNQPAATGYIFVCAGQKAVVAEAQLRANRARDYLINVREIDPGRVKAVDCGYQPDLTVYFYVVPPGTEPPMIESTIDPKDVQIIYEKKRRPRSRND